MQDATAIAANAQNLNVFMANAFSKAPFSGFLTVLSTGSAVGLELQVMIAGVLAVERQALNTNNRVPIMPDDVVVDGIPVMKGDLIQVSQFNTTAGSLTPRTRVILTEGDEVVVY